MFYAMLKLILIAIWFAIITEKNSNNLYFFNGYYKKFDSICYFQARLKLTIPIPIKRNIMFSHM